MILLKRNGMTQKWLWGLDSCFSPSGFGLTVRNVSVVP